jgi:hypothetical protein
MNSSCKESVEAIKYFSSEKSFSLTSRRHAPVLRLGPNPNLTLPAELCAHIFQTLTQTKFKIISRSHKLKSTDFACDLTSRRHAPVLRLGPNPNLTPPSQCAHLHQNTIAEKHENLNQFGFVN